MCVMVMVAVMAALMIKLSQSMDVLKRIQTTAEFDDSPDFR